MPLPEPLELLSELVALPSVNPMGGEPQPGRDLETRVSDFLCDWFQRLGVPWQRLEVASGRANVVAHWDSGNGGPLILLDAHQDTVPVDGMTIPPFAPTVRDGRLYGRGACDVKGGMAAMLCAFARLVQTAPANAASVVMCCSCDEEHTRAGMDAMVQGWQADVHDSWLHREPDAILIAEPTSLDVVVAHRGALRWKIRTTGRACHSSNPGQGVNAIYRMGQVLQGLEEYARQLPGRIATHPLCGDATLSVGKIYGGVSVNVVPDECLIEIDRRVLPGENPGGDPAALIDDVRQFLNGCLDFEPEMLPPWSLGETLTDEFNGPWSERLLQSIDVVAGPHRRVGAFYGTNAGSLATTRVPALVFGPGSIEQAHTKDEWIAIDQLRSATEIYYRFCAGTEQPWC